MLLVVAIVVGSILVFAVVAGRDSHTPKCCAGDAATYPIVFAMIHRKPFSLLLRAKKEGKITFYCSTKIFIQQHALNIDTTQFHTFQPSGGLGFLQGIKNQGAKAVITCWREM